MDNLGEHYAIDDLILPNLKLPDPCEVRISITEERVTLNVGQRDWEWKRGCPDVCSAGTLLDHPVPDISDQGGVE